jgi:hypothetical protein
MQGDDVGSVVAFLASQDARWITDDTIRVDGGSKLWDELQLRRISHATWHCSRGHEAFAVHGRKTLAELNKATKNIDQHPRRLIFGRWSGGHPLEMAA